jgi:DNA-binding transcriptional regulator YhcF (GntR family)
MCDTNSKAYHNAEQESFAKIQAEDEAALRHEIAEANLTEFLNEARAVGENFTSITKILDL